MRRVLLCVLLLTPAAQAHRLDEYLQATLIGITRTGIELELQLTPGVAVLPLVLSVIDRDHNGRISPEEERAYASLVAREVELKVDGAPAVLALMESTFPDLAAMQSGLGSIRIRLRTERTGRQVRFENRHLPKISAYLVNCLADPASKLAIGPQQRDEAQRSILFEYSFGSEVPSRQWLFWPAEVGILLLARTAMLAYRR